MPASRFRPAAELLEARSTPAALQTPGADGDTSDQLLAASTDGRYVLFVSNATNLEFGQSDAPGTPDLFWRDTATGLTKLVSHKAGDPLTAIGFGTPAAGQEAVPTARRAVLSGDGQTVAFVSANPAADHVRNGTTEVGTADDAGSNDVFVWRAGSDQLTLASRLVPIPSFVAGSRAVRGAFDPVLSDDGRYLAYASRVDAADIDPAEPADQSNTLDLFRVDLTALTTRLASDVPGANSAVGAFADVARPVGRYLSGDGQVLAFASAASANALVGAADRGNTLDVYARDLRVGTAAGLALVSRSRSGDAIGNVPVLAGFDPVLSRDGSTVVFASNAPGGTPAASIVGAYVDGGNSADLYAVRNPFNPVPAVFLVSAVSGSAGQGANGEVTRPAGTDLATFAPTADGRFVVFESAATNLVPGLADANGGTDVFVRELTALRTEAVSVGPNGTGSAPSAGPSISDDGRFVSFVSASPDLDPRTNDRNGAADVFVRDRTAGTTTLASAAGPDRARSAAGASTAGRVNAAGTVVLFASGASDLYEFLNTVPGRVLLYTEPLPLPPRTGAERRTLLVTGPAGGEADAFGFDADGQLSGLGGSLTPFPGVTAGPPRAVTADVTGDGVADFIFGVGAGGGSLLRVLDGATRAELIAPTPVYEPSFTGGLFVAAGDVDGFGAAEIVVSPDVGGGGRVRVFALAGGRLVVRADFFGIDDPTFRGGARVSVGDVNGDGAAEVIVAAGFGGGPRVAVFAGATLFRAPSAPARLVNDFFAFPGADAERLRNGVFVAAGDLNGDGRADLVFGGGPGGGPRVFALDGRLLTAGPLDTVYANPAANFFAFDSNRRGGVRPAVKDIDGDARLDLVVGSGDGDPAELRTYLGSGISRTDNPPVNHALAVSDVTLANGVYVG